MSLQRLKTEEDGQAILWGAGVIVLIVALFYGAVDIGELVLGKMEAQNAADSAAMTAVALKASLHNTRALAYRAASGQLVLCRMKLLEATGQALAEIGGPGGKHSAQYKDAMDKAHTHRRKLELLRDGIVAFNKWATGTQAGTRATRDAASTAYKANLGDLGKASRSNLTLVDSDSALPEISGGSANSVIFRSEAMSANGKAGKTAVVIKPMVGAFGGGFLGYGDHAQLSAVSVAGFMDAKTLYGTSLPAIDTFGTQWYVTRLLPVGKGQLGN